MKALYYLSINGAIPVRAESLGWSVETITLRNLGADECTMRRVRRDTSVGLTYKDIVRIIAVMPDGSSRAVMQGKAMPPALTQNEGTDEVRVTVKNWWWDAEQLTYCNCPWGRVTAGGEYTQWDGVEYLAGQTLDTGTTPDTLPWPYWADPDTNLYAAEWTSASAYINLTLQQELLEKLNYIIARNPGQLSTTEADWQLGTTIGSRSRPVKDRDVASMIVETMSIRPDAFLWTDYSTTIPQVYADAASELPVRSIRRGVDGLQNISLTPLNEMQVEGVTVMTKAGAFSQWAVTVALNAVNTEAMYRGFHAFSAGFFEYYAYPPATARLDDPHNITISMDWSESETESTNLNRVPPDLAQQIYESLNPLRCRGNLTWNDEGFQIGIRPGLRLSYDGAGINFGEILIQEVTHNVARGQTVATCGYPTPLGLDERLNRYRYIYRSTFGDNLARLNTVGPDAL